MKLNEDGGLSSQSSKQCQAARWGWDVKPGEEYDGKLKSLVGRFSAGKVVTHAAKLQTMNLNNDG